MAEANRYEQIIEHVFKSRYRRGDESFEFDREDLVEAARAVGVKLPKNIGDVIYSFRYRGELPESIRRAAPRGKSWIIEAAGRSKYRFVAAAIAKFAPTPMLAEIKVPDSTPGLIAMYARTDEQSLLAKLRYNRLLDIFTGVACYSLQSHWRSTAPDIGQAETDELYVGIDRHGIHYVFPVQAKGGRDNISVVQISQDLALCRATFPSLICRPIAAQFMGPDLIALFELQESPAGPRIANERHYRLVPPDQLSEDELQTYRAQAAAP